MGRYFVAPPPLFPPVVLAGMIHLIRVPLEGVVFRINTVKLGGRHVNL